MRRILPFLFLTFAGCSNAPVAGFLDSCFPSRAKADPNPKPNPGPGVDVNPRPPVDPIRPGPTPNPDPVPAAELQPVSSHHAPRDVR